MRGGVTRSLRNRQSFCALAQFLGIVPSGEVACCRVDIHSSDHPEWAARAVREFNGNMPVEGGKIESR